MTAQTPQELAERASALHIRGAVAKTPLLQRFADAHSDALSYLAGIGLAVILAPFVEFLLTGESTLLRFLSGSGEGVEPPQWSQRAARVRVFGTAQELQDAVLRASLAQAPSTLPGETIGNLPERLYLRPKKFPNTGATSSALAQNADILREAIAALSHPPTSPSATAPTAKAVGAAATSSLPDGAKMLGSDQAQGNASPGFFQRLWGKTAKTFSGRPNTGTEDQARASKPNFMQKSFDPGWQSKLKQLDKSSGGGGSSGSSGAAAAGGAGGLTLYQAAAAAMAAAQNAALQAQILQQMGDGLNTNFEGPWQNDPFLAPLHADLVQAKAAVLSSASALQAYAGQLQAHAGALYNDAGAFSAYIQNPSGAPPSPTASPVGPPPDISGNMATTEAAIADVQRLLNLLQQAAAVPTVGARSKVRPASTNFDGTGNRPQGGP